MKFLVLGSSGVVGKPLVDLLRQKGHDVYTFDIEESEYQDLRIANNLLLESYIEDSDFVFHLAWDVGGSVYLSKYQNSFDFIQNNLKIIVNSFELLNKHKKPFIFASSQMSNMSYSTYGITKFLGECLTNSLNGINVKFWNVYGYEHDLTKSHVITDFILKAKNTSVIDMMTDGTELRQMLHADDCAECLLTLSQHYDDLPRNQNYHISSFEWVDVLSIAKLIAEKFPGTKIVPAEKKDQGQRDKRNEPDPSILKYWKPKITLDEGLAAIIDKMK